MFSVPKDLSPATFRSRVSTRIKSLFDISIRGESCEQLKLITRAIYAWY